VTEQQVTAQWSYVAFAPGLAMHYSHLLQGCMAATSGRSRNFIACEEDGAELWIGEVLQL
jgi:hypothetical protein